MSTGVIVVGAGGKMGARLCALAHADDAFALVGAVERAGAAQIGARAAPRSAKGEAPVITDSVEKSGATDVVIDFSGPLGSAAAVALARRVGCALLVGTTGLAPEAVGALKAESASRAVLLAPNTSLGVAVLSDVVRRAAAMLKGYECSIVESHHSQKKDAPSGTALRLADAVRAGGASLAKEQIVSVRGGDVVGEHTVRLAGAGEYIELTHRATSRDLFARGALTAAAWLKGRPAGWYTMEDVLGLRG